jgi:hypothetical protein
MLCRTEYDLFVRLLNRAIGAGLASVVFSLGLVALSATANAQINGMPASVTSPGFGGRQVNGVAPSVTSLGPRGYTPGSPTCCFRGATPPKGFATSHPNPDFRHHAHNGNLAWGGVYAAPYYGYYDSGTDVASDPSGDQYNGGPTIFDRRGSGAAPPPSTSYPARPRSYSAQSQPTDPAEQDETASASDQPQTVLVFKDGHQVEVANYAIVGSTLYDLSSGHRQKIALNDLDLSATAKQNGDRGIDFQLPSKSEAN